MRSQRHRAVPTSASTQIEALETRCLLSAISPTFIAGAIANINSAQNAGANGIAFTDQDIGSPAVAGSSSYSNGTYSVTAAGTGIGGNGDQFNFAAVHFTGDGSVVARLASLVNTSTSAQAGITIRSGSAANAAVAALVVTPSNQLQFITRAIDGGTAGQTTTFISGLPQYLKLSITAGSISAFSSTDGVTWKQTGTTQTVGVGANPLVGLAACSANAAATTTATFTNVSLLPANFSDYDINAPAPRGWASFDPATDSYTIDGGGSDIGTGSTDQFNLAGVNMTGDGSIVAQVQSLTNTNTGAKAGLVVREDVTAGAAFAAVLETPQNGVVFAWRTSSGAAASSTTVAGITGPVWLKLTKLNGGFSAYDSTDGVSWSQIGASQSIAMTSATTLAGLAVTSHNTSALNTAVFASVSVLPAGFQDADVGPPAMAGSAVYDAPSDTYTVTGNGSDIYGTADQFNFASRTMSGDGSAIVYVNAITNTDPWAKAGMMLRVDQSAGSAFAGLFASAQNGVVFEWRTAAGAAVQQEISSPPGGPVLAPVSLKLTRTANQFAAFYSTDGINWISVGPSQSVTMPVNISAGLAVTSHNPAALCTATFSSLGIGAAPPPAAGVYSSADQLFLNDLEFRETQFFYNETNASTGLVPDSSNASGGSPSAASSIASLGFGLTSLTISDQRGWLTHNNAYQRALTTVNFLYNTAASVNGFFYHFLDPTTGARSPGSELSSVDTAELIAGVLSVAQYWAGTPVQTTAMNIYNRVNWPWMQRANGHFYGAWTPESGFSGDYGDFSEAALLYLLPLGSTTHPTTAASWNSWSRTPVIHYGSYTYVTADDAALFTVQYPQAWFNLQNMTDATGLNYYTNAQTATLAQRQWMTDISTTWSDYGPNLWGLTPSDSKNGYTVWGGPPANGPIDGTVVPTGPGGSLAFTPRLALSALENMKQNFAGTYQKYGLVDALNPLTHWTSSLVLGIDIGMTVVAAENARSNFVWNIFGQLPAARQALAAAFPSLTPSAQSAASRKPQGASGTLDVPIDMSTGAPLAVEARAGGPTQIVITFGANIVAGPSFAVTLSRLGGGADGSVGGVTLSGSTLTINLSGVVDDQTLVVHIADLRNTSTSASGNYTLQLGVLAGDANGDGSVSVGDLGALATSYGVSTGMTPATGDFTGDGAVDVADLGVLATNYGKSVASGTATTLATAASVASPAAVATSVFNDNVVWVITGNDDHRRRGHRRSSVDDLLRPA